MGERELVVVAGATGYLGRYVVRALHRRGYRVRALVRSEARLDFARSAADEVFVGHATRPETLEGLCDGARIVFSSLGLRAAWGRPTVWEVDRDANLTLLRLAERSGVERFVFVSVLHGERLRRRVPQVEAREQVVDALRRSALRTTVLRPTGFFNDMAEFFHMARRGRLWLVGEGHGAINPIHGADLAEFVADRIEAGDEGGHEVGGLERFTQRGIGELAFEVLARPPRFGRLSPRLLEGAAALVAPFSPNLHNMLRFLAALGTEEGLAPPTGRRTLRAFFEDLRDGVPVARAGDVEAAGREGARGAGEAAPRAAQRVRS